MKNSNQIRSILIILIALVLIISSISFVIQKKSSKKPTNNKVDSQTSDVASSDEGDKNEEDKNSGDPEDEEYGDDDESDDYDYDDGYDEDEEDEEEEDEDDDIVYTSPIQKFGTKTSSAANRTITVKQDQAVFKNFMSLGANVFPAVISAEGQSVTGMNDVYFEIEKKRFVSSNPQIARVLFNIDFMITNEEKNPYRDDWKNNIDYINYKNGKYDFNSDKMKAVYRYLDLLKSIDSKVELCFGWKVAQRIQPWFSLDESAPDNSAPADLKAYGKACAALMKELYRRGYSNIISLTFAVEPGFGYDFNTIGSFEPYYIATMREADAALKSLNLRNKLEFWAADQAGFLLNRSMNDYFYKNSDSLIGGYSAHMYYNTSNTSWHMGYDELFEACLYGSNKYGKKPFYLTEYAVGTREATESNGVHCIWSWETTPASALIGLANSGAAGGCLWDYGMNYWPDPIKGWSTKNGKDNLWQDPTSVEKINTGINDLYYNQSLLQNYVKSHSDVLMVNWEGSDIRTSAFRGKDGSYTVVVEANKSTVNRNLSLEFSKSIGKDFYRISYVYPYENNPNGTVPPSDKLFRKVGNKITDTIGKDYGIYIYTTQKPKKQVEIDQVGVSCEVNGSIQFNARLIDCDKSDEVVWSITESTNSEAKGSIDSSGRFTANGGLKSGDLVSIRATLKGNPLVYSVGVIKIQ